LDGLEKYAESIVKAWEVLPQQLRERLWFGGLSWSGYGQMVDQIYNRIYNRTDHDIEGFEENGWYEPEWSINGRGDWRSIHDIQNLPQAMQDLAIEAARTPGFTRVRKWSPREAWESGLDALVKLPHWILVDMVGFDAGKTVRVQGNHLIEFEDKNLGNGKHRYLASVETPAKQVMQLAIFRATS